MLKVRCLAPQAKPRQNLKLFSLVWGVFAPLSCSSSTCRFRVTDISPSIFVFCALVCEAKPLIRVWQLKKLPSSDHPFSIYVGTDRVLVVTGIGKINMAGAMSYALALFNKPHSPVLINLGIAGQRDEALGALCLGHKITDRESGRCFYPQMPFSVPCKTYSVVTACQPIIDYSADEIYEMEAAGFYEIAVKFSLSELCHVMKIVSDNAQSAIADINEALVEAWVVGQIPAIEAIMKRLIELRRLCIFPLNPVYQEMLEEFHFTVSRASKLKALLQRWQALKGCEAIAWREANLRSAKELLFWIEQQLDNVDFLL